VVDCARRLLHPVRFAGSPGTGVPGSGRGRTKRPAQGGHDHAIARRVAECAPGGRGPRAGPPVGLHGDLPAPPAPGPPGPPVPDRARGGRTVPRRPQGAGAPDRLGRRTAAGCSRRGGGVGRGGL
ncbi:MAG: hypothetical protein AVDCRST_MAG88-3099, partial [uncultured Thermomicrobiales bacterium]